MTISIFARLAIVFSLAVIWSGPLVLAQSDEDSTGAIELDPQQTSPVIEYSMFGGMPRPSAAGFQPEPKLRVWADGRVVVGRTNPQAVRCEAKVPAEEVQQLLNFVVRQHEFFSADTEKIKAAIEATGRPVRLMDSRTSRIVVRVGNRTHQVEVYALGFVASEYPEVADLAHLAQIERELKKWVGICQLGGVDAMKEALNAVNQKLKQQYPDVAPMTLENFVSASRSAKGSVIAVFQKHVENDEGTTVMRIDAQWMKQPDSEPVVNVYASRRDQRQ